jgi:hypothetical protein
MVRQPRRTDQPRIVGRQIMMPADLPRLQKYMQEIAHNGSVSDEMRPVCAKRMARTRACTHK